MRILGGADYQHFVSRVNFKAVLYLPISPALPVGNDLFAPANTVSINLYTSLSKVRHEGILEMAVPHCRAGVMHGFPSS